MNPTNGGTICVALKDSGRGRGFFFFKLTIVLAECAPEEGIRVKACSWVHLNGETIRRAMKKLAGAPKWRNHTPRYEKAGRCTYTVKPPGFFFILFFPPSQSPNGGAPIW